MLRSIYNVLPCFVLLSPPFASFVIYGAGHYFYTTSLHRRRKQGGEGAVVPLDFLFN